MKRQICGWLMLIAAVLMMPTLAQDTPGVRDGSVLDGQLQTLKGDVQALQRELALLEEELLFPEAGQLAVFVSLEAGPDFRLDALQLKIDNKEVANHLYLPEELAALRRGGVQRLYLGNTKSGEHTLQAALRTPGLEAAAEHSFRFSKPKGAHYLQIKLHANGQQADVSLREWE